MRFNTVFVRFLTAVLLQITVLEGQQLEPETEIYGMAGAYFFGSEPHILKSREWASQGTIGVLVPIGTKWGVMVDTTLSTLKVNEGLHSPDTGYPTSLFYKVNPDILQEDWTTQSMVAVFPSFVRLWRRDRFTVYFGGGLGFEHQRQSIRYRDVGRLEDVDFAGEKFRSLVESDTVRIGAEYFRYEAFSTSRDIVTSSAVFVHGGVLVSITKRLSVRAGYSWILTYIDSPPSQSLGAGIGYRF